MSEMDQKQPPQPPTEPAQREPTAPTNVSSEATVETKNDGDGDGVTEASEESFPASDAPPWTSSAT